MIHNVIELKISIRGVKVLFYALVSKTLVKDKLTVVYRYSFMVMCGWDLSISCFRVSSNYLP